MAPGGVPSYGRPMRAALVALVLAAPLAQAAPAAAACSPLDPAHEVTPVRVPSGAPGYRAFFIWDCATLTAAQADVRIVDTDTPFAGMDVAEYRPAPGSTGAASVSLVGDGRPLTFRVLRSPAANTPAACLRYNEPVLGVDERAEMRVACFDADGDAPALAPKSAPLGSLSPLQVIGRPAAPWDITLYSTIFTVTDDAGPGAGALTPAFDVGDGFVWADAGRYEPFTVALPADQAPACAGTAAHTARRTPVALALACSDPDPGDAIGITVVSGPAHGTLSPVTASGVVYTPAPGWSGTDTFTFGARDGRTRSAPASATVVTAAGGRPRRVLATVGSHWVGYRRYVTADRLVVTDAPARATVKILCRGGGCPFGRRAVRRARGGAFRATRWFRKRRLRAGAAVEVRVLVPGMVGKVVRFRIAPPGTPRGRRLCLPPGAAKPARC